MPAATRKRKYAKRPSKKRKYTKRSYTKRRRTSTKRGGNRRLNARVNSSVHFSKPVRATNANKRRKSDFTINFKDLALSVYPEHKGRYIMQGHNAWPRGYQAVQLVSFGHPAMVFRELLKAAFARNDFRSMMSFDPAVGGWYTAQPWANQSYKWETGNVDTTGNQFNSKYLFVPRNDLGSHDNNDVVRWYPNSNTNLYATIYQKHIVTIVNPTQVTIEIDIYTSKPKGYLHSDKQRLLGCWEKDHVANMSPNTMAPADAAGLTTEDSWRRDVRTDLEGFDLDWPLIPEDDDQIVHAELLSNIPGEKPFKSRNETVRHHHSKIGEITKLLAPGEEFKFSVEIPTYKFNPSLLMRDLELRREDSLVGIAQTTLNTVVNLPGVTLNDEEKALITSQINRFITMPLGWKHQKDVTIIAKAQNSFATNITPTDTVYENSYMVEDGSNINPEYGIHHAAAQLFYKVDSRFTTRCLPLQQKTVYSYSDQTRGAKQIPVGNSNHPRESVVNVENDNQQHVHTSTYANPFVPVDTSTNDPDLIDIVDGI